MSVNIEKNVAEIAAVTKFSRKKVYSGIKSCAPDILVNAKRLKPRFRENKRAYRCSYN